MKAVFLNQDFSSRLEAISFFMAMAVAMSSCRLFSLIAWIFFRAPPTLNSVSERPLPRPRPRDAASGSETIKKLFPKNFPKHNTNKKKS